jgi:hypothetical protein
VKCELTLSGRLVDHTLFVWMGRQCAGIVLLCFGELLKDSLELPHVLLFGVLDGWSLMYTYIMTVEDF